MAARLLPIVYLLVVALPLGAQQPKSGTKISTGQPSDTAKSIIDKRAAQLSNVNKLNQAKTTGPDPIASVVQSAAKIPSSAREYPKAWKEITERRAKLAESSLTQKESAILKALDTTLRVDCAKTPLRDVLAFLMEKTGQAIVVPQFILEEADVDYSTPVTLKIGKGDSMRSILRKVLRDNGLTYVVKDECIVVTTPERAKESMVLRTYPVGDVVDDPRSPNNKALKKIHAEHLIRIIYAMIEPQLWEVNGGSAVIVYNAEIECFIVRAPGEVHLRLGAVGFVHRTK